MYARTHTIAIFGVDPIPVMCEVQIQNGLPSMMIVGLPSKTVAESKERIRASLTSIGLALPAKKITLNLSPANVKKEGSHYDLPMALALLAAMDIIPQDILDRYVSLGELGLNGQILKAPGCLLAALHAKDLHKALICPMDQKQEVNWIKGLNVLCHTNLLQLKNDFSKKDAFPHFIAYRPLKNTDVYQDHYGTEDPFLGIVGQHQVKRALIIAASGWHHVLMKGSPGSGKSLLAAQFSKLLPAMRGREILEVSSIYSVACLLKEGLITKRPYRTPHHSASTIALIGGGRPISPGEISLAHNGALFLDEIPEFSSSTLESLRQPIESHKVLIARANEHVIYPARFILIAAMNPCKCGGDTCTRGPSCRINYEHRISEPMYDRIDLFIPVEKVNYKDVVQESKIRHRSSIKKSSSQTSNTLHPIYQQINKAVIMQRARYKNSSILYNGDLQGDQVEKFISIQQDAKDLVMKAFDTLNLSMRGYHRVLKVARTIADLEGSNYVHTTHVAEAISYRRAGN